MGRAHPSRGERRDIERERAWDRCERAKVREIAELEALRRKTMRDVRRWREYREHECAFFAAMTR